MASLGTCHDPTHTNKDELIGRAFTKGSGIFTTTFIIFKAPTLAFPFALAFTPGLPGMYTYVNLQNATNLALELFV